MSTRENVAKETQIDDVKELVARGKEKGWLTAEEIVDALGVLDLSAEQVDGVYALIAEESIEVLETRARHPRRADRRFPAGKRSC